MKIETIKLEVQPGDIVIARANKFTSGHARREAIQHLKKLFPKQKLILCTPGLALDTLEKVLTPADIAALWRRVPEKFAAAQAEVEAARVKEAGA
jgi:hypothetical protein